ncbi:hypothetical protein LZ30DRAFT_193561 [Colletotrichum cereale]|nr:hypothetical protein LZ30DRAFT_193561 [Colletotrichum cereale]
MNFDEHPTIYHLIKVANTCFLMHPYATLPGEQVNNQSLKNYAYVPQLSLDISKQGSSHVSLAYNVRQNGDSSVSIQALRIRVHPHRAEGTVTEPTLSPIGAKTGPQLTRKNQQLAEHDAVPLSTTTRLAINDCQPNLERDLMGPPRRSRVRPRQGPDLRKQAGR